MSFIAVIGGGLAAIGAGASLYNSYKQGKTLEQTNWSGMQDDVSSMFKENLLNLRNRADVAFEKVENQFKAKTSGMSDKATSMWDEMNNSSRGFTGDFQGDFASIMDNEGAEREADIAVKEKELAEEQQQLRFEGEELAMTQQKEEELAELGGGEESSKGWYPGKYISSIWS